MIDFVKTPNLPQGSVKTLICGKADEIILSFIKSLGIDIAQSCENRNVDPRISNHADISVHHIGGNKILLDQSQLELGETLKLFGVDISYTRTPLGREYPNDSRLNFARVGSFLIGRQDCIDETLLNLLQAENLKNINVKQGYGKCSVCVVDENALITEDEGVYQAASRNGIDCLLIGKGGVRLDGFDFGFIGGACGMIGKGHLLFFGDITAHGDYYKINGFLDKYGCRFDYIRNYPLTDIGGIIPLIE